MHLFKFTDAHTGKPILVNLANVTFIQAGTVEILAHTGEVTGSKECTYFNFVGGDYLPVSESLASIDERIGARL